jgi:hypothetical protein
MSQIPRFHRTELIVPRSIRGYGPDEFLTFEWDSSIDPTKFRVLTEDLSGRWLQLSPTLTSKVLIPNTYFAPHCLLVVVGLNKDGKQVRWSSEMHRGSHYRLTGTEGDNYAFRSVRQVC